MLASLMAMQAGLPGLDFSGIRGKNRDRYFAAVRAAWERDYDPMRSVFKEVVLKVWFPS
jgi:cell filamentation protein